MNNLKHYIALVGCLAAVAMTGTDALAQDSQWLQMNDSLRADQLMMVAWNNPAIMQLARERGESSVGAGITVRDENDDASRPMLDVQRGDYNRTWSLGARTHIKHGSSTLWGHARYDNGFTRGISWNETSDLSTVYPYVLADSVTSARMKMERYSFGGGYADNNGNWYWGASIAYTAGLHYRSVDPRPRNVTSDLRISAGLGKRLTATYVGAVAVNFQKYKQTNDVSFYSELGHDKIFHLTGLTNDYGRFAGTGESSYYNGYRWGATLNLHPVTRQGLAAAVSASRLSFDNILTALNKLPLAHVTDNAIEGELAWLDGNWGARATVTAGRRVGTENVFGDASSAIYPEIGSNDMYHENRFAVRLDGQWKHLFTPTVLGQVAPFVTYQHRNEIYADPQCQWLLNAVEWGTQLMAAASAGRFTPAMTLGVAFNNPIDSKLMLSQIKSELTGLQAAQEAKFDYLSHSSWRLQAMLSLQARVSARQAVRLDVGGAWAFYTHGLTVAQPQVTLAYLF